MSKLLQQSMEGNAVTNGERSCNNSIVRLSCSVKNYDWGRIGSLSSVARLYARNTGADIHEEEPYAEFWMGTHPSGPSYLAAVRDGSGAANGVAVETVNGGKDAGGLSLKTWIEQNPAVLGDKVRATWGPDLPFLFKVISVAKALSIQAHPDKELAEILHKKRPDVYKDENHKPEMALALTDFEALCGFISLEELKGVLLNVPEIVDVIGNSCADRVLNMNEQDVKEKAKDGLRSLLAEIMSAGKDVISLAVTRLVNRLNTKNKDVGLADKEQLILRLEKQYPADVGLIVALLLNHVQLKPGEALYIGANEPHAYISGDCVECMATSDNVVRVGLTSKDRDANTLCSMLTYKQGSANILEGITLNKFTTRYSPPFDEFEVDRCILPKATTTVFPAVPGPSILLFMAGRGTVCTESAKEVVVEGDVIFTPADTEVIVATTASGLNLFRAGVNSRFF